MNGRSGSGTRWAGRLIVAVGLARLIAGAGALLTVRSQLAAERIRIPSSSSRLAGQPVRVPLSAYAEADFIKRSTLQATGGKTYGELEEGDPAAQMAMEASLLRSSLFTSVLAFAVAAGELVLGGSLVVIGASLKRLAPPA